MLVYANHFEIIDSDCENKVFRTIKGWLKAITKLDLSTADLKSGNDFSNNQYFIRTIKDEYAGLFSIYLSHYDAEVEGREWKSEIGIKINESSLFLSLIVETIEQSTLVDESAQSTRPKLIQFLQKNCHFDLNTTGLNTNFIDNNLESFRRLKNEILNPNRNYPIVLVSCIRDNNLPFVECSKLQEHLFGLAQVYFLDESVNSYELENFMGTTKYCTWDGAINIIYPINKFGKISNRLFTRNRLDELENIKSGIFRTILAYVTHYTNIRKKSKHLSTYDVKLESLKNRRNQLKREIENLDFETNFEKLNEYKLLSDELFKELSKAEENFSDKLRQQENSFIEILSQNEQQIGELSDENNQLKSKILQLEYLQSNTNTKVVGDNIVTVNSGEKDLYADEIKIFILEAVHNYFNNLPQNDKNTRKYHILNSLVNSNQQILNKKENFLARLKNEFRGHNKLTKNQKDLLLEFNIELKNEVSHNTIGFIGDDRYTMTFAKTASDTRAGENIVRDIKKQLF